MDAPKPPLIYSLMREVLDELPAIGKDERNANLNFPYRSIDTILGILNPIMAKKGLSFVCGYSELVREVRERSGVDKVTVMVTVRGSFTFYAPDGSFVTASAYGEGFDMADKATMKAETAALKVALAQTFLIPAHDATDPDAHNPDDGGRKRETPPRGTVAARVRDAGDPAHTPPKSAATTPHPTGGDIPEWWEKGVVVPDAVGTANDQTGAGVPVTGCIRFLPYERPESGSKEKRWLSLNKTPWENLTWIGIARQQAKLYKDGVKPTVENSAIEWLLTTAGRGAYKGAAGWIGETCVALDYFAGKAVGKKEEAPVPKDFDPDDPNIPGLDLDNIPF